MKLLALETSGMAGSVAAFDGGKCVEAMVLTPDQRTAQSLAPGIAALLHDCGWEPTDVNVIGVTIGPGSFTGLRAGVATAKTFAYAVGADVIGIGTLEAIAFQAGTDRAWAVVDAQRNQVFAAMFVRSDDRMRTVAETQILDDDTWLGMLKPGDVVSGPGLSKLHDRLPEGVDVVAESNWRPTATTVGCLAWARYQRGDVDDVWKLHPQYFRKSAAEEKLEARSD